jgi:glycosyltransferase involved in cell wall biosynthesis
MPAYNVGRFVETALQSVLAQTYSRLEVIVIDDGSKDETREVLRSISDPRLQFLENEHNLGGFQTMNKAIGLSGGEMIAVYHSDDYYDAQIVEKEVAFLLSHPEAGAVFCMDKFMNFDGQVYGGLRLPREFGGRSLFSYDDVFPFLLRNKNILLRCPTFMARWSTLDTVGLFDGERFGIAADLDLWIRILRRYPVGILDEQLMQYRFGDQQWSQRYKKFRTSQELYFEIMDHYIEVDRWRERLQRNDLVEYEFHRYADKVFRSLNCVRLDRLQEARELLGRPFPWRTFLVPTAGLFVSKLKVLVKSILLKLGLAIGGGRILTRLVGQSLAAMTRN